MLTLPSSAVTAPLLRALFRTPVAGVVLLATAPSVYAAVRGHNDLSFPVAVASIIGAACVGFAVDDPAEASLNQCPTPRATRRWCKAALISMMVALS